MLVNHPPSLTNMIHPEGKPYPRFGPLGTEWHPTTKPRGTGGPSRRLGAFVFRTAQQLGGLTEVGPRFTTPKQKLVADKDG